MESKTVTLQDIREAAAVLDGRVLRTPCLPARALSELTGAEVVLKLECLQHTGSFKVRGAGVKLARLTEAERRIGVVAASAGNHAQGVAYHARALGIPAVIVMPKGTPFNKIARTEALGARVALEGDTLVAAKKHARRLADKHGYVLVHPYDDPAVIAGQGTIALEMLEEMPDLDMLVVPVGGGGLIAGVATAARAMKPGIEVVGAEAAAYPCMVRALGGTAPEPGGPTLAEGIAVKTPGELTRPIVAETVSEVRLADEIALERAVYTFLDVQRLVVEGAGAAPLAVMLETPERFRGRRVGLVVSGGNIDSRLLASVLMRGLVRDGRVARLRIGLPDIPGALARVSGVIGDSGGNIVEVYHQRLFYDVPVKEAEVDVVVETEDTAHVCRIVEQLSADGFPVRVLSATSNGGPDDHMCQT